MTRTAGQPLPEADRHQRDLTLQAHAGHLRRLRKRRAVYAVLALLRRIR
jgi:hypothetical protein